MSIRRVSHILIGTEDGVQGVEVGHTQLRSLSLRLEKQIGSFSYGVGVAIPREESSIQTGNSGGNTHIRGDIGSLSGN